ncbi:MAG: hypothetical protein JWM47_3220 [Acidimicrobiales bacterium]|nr:hypothetical protein [Acidimicrobiales bacterium]
MSATGGVMGPELRSSLMLLVATLGVPLVLLLLLAG